MFSRFLLLLSIIPTTTVFDLRSPGPSLLVPQIRGYIVGSPPLTTDLWSYDYGLA